MKIDEEMQRLILTALTILGMGVGGIVHWIFPGLGAGWVEGLAMLSVFLTGGVPAAIRA
ncbi:hypothetical protein C8J30_1181, partial [Rhodobacter viridis]